MRNPLIDPRPGDIVQSKLNGKHYARRVIDVKLGDSGLTPHRARHVTFKRLAGHDRKPETCHISEWHRWCNLYKGEVIERSEEP